MHAKTLMLILYVSSFLPNATKVMPNLPYLGKMLFWSMVALMWYTITYFDKYCTAAFSPKPKGRVTALMTELSA